MTTPDLFGQGSNLTAVQMCVRAGAGFVIAVILVRIAGRRSFGMRSPFDVVISLLLGAVLSRAVVGASPFWPTVAASTVLALLHRLFGLLGTMSHRIGRVIKGESIVVFANGTVDPVHLRRALISVEDLTEAVRVNLNQNSFDGIEQIRVERNGEVGIVVAQPK
jgi:uncharacterized membrane protein YcaP (DUF421 family)